MRNISDNGQATPKITGVQTMSSREIAELLGRRHDHVLRDIRVMLIELLGKEKLDELIPERYRNRHKEYCRQNADSILNQIIGGSPDRGNKEFQGFSWKRDNRGFVSEIQLDKRYTLIFVSASDVHLRTRIIDRWAELEEQAKPQIDLEDPAFLRATLLDYTDKVIALQEEVKELTPKAEGLDRIAAWSEGTLCVTDAAKALQMQRKDLFRWLQSNRWLYRRAGNAHWVGYQDKIQQGLVEMKVGEIIKPNGDSKITENVRITPKGLAKLSAIHAGV